MKCNTCGQVKSIELFDKNKRCKSGHRPRCKECHRIYNLKYRQANREKLRISGKKNYYANHEKLKEKWTNKIFKNTGNWRKYFIDTYGISPHCECCGRVLGWFTGNQSESVNLDHRMDGHETIKRPPAEWLQNNKCTPENIKIIESCNFGILCLKCNRLLPTMDRLERLGQLMRYAEKRV